MFKFGDADGASGGGGGRHDKRERETKVEFICKWKSAGRYLDDHALLFTITIHTHSKKALCNPPLWIRR